MAENRSRKRSRCIRLSYLVESRGILERPCERNHPSGKSPTQKKIQNGDRIELGLVARCKCREEIHSNREDEKKDKSKAIIVVDDLRE